MPPLVLNEKGEPKPPFVFLPVREFFLKIFGTLGGDRAGRRKGKTPVRLLNSGSPCRRRSQRGGRCLSISLRIVR
jgi:hypothetical protein